MLIDIYSPLGILFVFSVSFFIIRLPIFSATDHKWHSTTSRSQTLDGLRGYLALGVFLHHALIYYRYLAEGIWDNPPSTLYTQLGPVGVSLFFMITGYLFWMKILSHNGKPEWIKLFVGRIFRITPVYYLLTALMLLIISIKTDFELRESPDIVFKELMPLLFFGLFEPGKMINGFPSPRGITAAVTWTLRYEWIFYLLILPASSLFARNKVSHFVYSLGMLIFLLIGFVVFDFSSNSLLLAAFFTGMLCASFQDISIGDNLPSWIKSLLVCAIFLIIFFEPIPVSDSNRVILTGVIFYLIVNGCSVFGLLLRIPAQRLGEISYGIYLLQGVILYSYSQISALKDLALLNFYNYWIFVSIETISLIFLAYLAYYFVEKPGIELGKKVALLIRPRPAKRC